MQLPFLSGKMGAVTPVQPGPMAGSRLAIEIYRFLKLCTG